MLFSGGQRLLSGWHVFVALRDSDDGVRPRLELELDLGTPPTLGLAAVDRVRLLAATALGGTSVQDDLDAVVGTEPFAEIGIQIGVVTGDDEKRASHLSLVRRRGNCAQSYLVIKCCNRLRRCQASTFKAIAWRHVQSSMATRKVFRRFADRSVRLSPGAEQLRILAARVPRRPYGRRHGGYRRPSRGRGRAGGLGRSDGRG